MCSLHTFSQWCILNNNTICNMEAMASVQCVYSSMPFYYMSIHVTTAMRTQTYYITIKVFLKILPYSHGDHHPTPCHLSPLPITHLFYISTIFNLSLYILQFLTFEYKSACLVHFSPFTAQPGDRDCFSFLSFFVYMMTKV